MAEQKPVIFLIHGAWHTTAPYRQLLDIFEAKGYTTAAPELPSGAEPMPADPPESDIRCCNKELQWLVDEGKEVVVVAHSYGGVVAPEAALGLGVRERSAKGLAGGVSRVVYLAAFMLEPGRTLEMNAPIDSVPWVEYRGDIKVVNENFDAGDIFYSDLPREEQLKWMSCCTKHPKACSFYAPKTMPRNEIDSTFFYTEYDQAFPVDMQRAMVGQLKAGGVQIGEVSLKSSHSPMLSMPDVLAEKILEVI